VQLKVEAEVQASYSRSDDSDTFCHANSFARNASVGHARRTVITLGARYRVAVQEELAADVTEHVRAICLALPEVTERPSHGSPAFFVRDKKQFAMLWASGHHDHDFPHLWCAAPVGAQESLIASGPDRFFRPPYVGHRGWIGVRLDGDVDWSEISELAQDAYRAIAPACLVALLDA
jgi:hypothetical protein